MIVITYPWAQKYRPHHTISSRRTCPIVQVAGPKLSLVVRCSKPLHPGMVPPRTCYTITSFYACAGGTNAAAGTPSRVTRGGVKGHKADLRCQCIWTASGFVRVLSADKNTDWLIFVPTDDQGLHWVLKDIAKTCVRRLPDGIIVKEES
jgi:hypothetical protein